MKLRTFILLALLYSWFGKDGKAQQTQPVSTPQPNLILQMPFTAVATSPVIDNRQIGALTYVLTVSVPTTVGAVSLQFETAQDNGSANCSTCTWTAATPATGSNPNTLLTGWNATFTTALTTYYDFVRLNLTIKTGAGIVSAKLYSSIAGGGPGGGGGGGGSGCVGTTGTPCRVAGPTPDGSAVAFPGVLIAGTDGIDVWSLFSDNLGGLYPAGNIFGLVDGTSNNISSAVVDHSNQQAAVQTFPMVFGGNFWDRQFIGQLSHAITITTAAAIVVPGLAATTTRLTAISFSLAAATTVTIVEGTTTATPCDTGQVALSGTYQNVQYFSPPISAAIYVTPGDDVCIILGGVSTGGGLAQYAQY